MTERWIPNPRPFPPRPPHEWPDLPPRTPASSPTPPEDPEKREGRTGMVLAVIGVALLAAVVTFLILLAVRPPKKQVASPYRTVPNPPFTTVAPTTTVPREHATVLTPAALRSLTDRLTPFVQEKRQLTFTTPPSPILDDDTAYLKAWHAHLARSDPMLKRLEAPYRVLGLNPNSLDLVKAQREAFGDKGVVFYDATTNQIHVRKVPGTTYVSTMLVAALTQQLDDQHFNVERIDNPSAFGDSTIGLTTLVVGDGGRVAAAWLGQADPTAQDQALQEAAGRSGNFNNPSVVPHALASWLYLPYDSGPTYTDDAVTSTSSKSLDALFENPPDGSAQVLTPNRYQAEITQLDVATPKADGKVEVSGTWGALYLQDMLGAVVKDDALRAAMTRYRGDSLVAWKVGKQTCVRLDVSTGTSAIGPMRAALADWAGKTDGKVSLQPDAKRPGKQVVRLDVCDPSSGGGSGSTTTTTAPSGPGGGSVDPDPGSPY